MVEEDWRSRWAEGRTGWHEPEGNAGLHAAWPALPEHSSVLVPLCGKSPDLLWLAKRGHEVTGIELSEIAVRDFFAENAIEYDTSERGPPGSLLCCGLAINDYIAETISSLPNTPMTHCMIAARWSRCRVMYAGAMFNIRKTCFGKAPKK